MSLPKLPDCLLAELNESGVLTLTLNRPDALNAFDDELSFALHEGLKFAEKDKAVRAILLTGAGRGFCAGQDLKSRSIQAGSDAQVHLGESIRKRYAPIINKLSAIEKPVLAAVNGVAAGAGASIAFACDIRLCVPEAKFIQAFVKVGLIPDSGACWLLPRLIGYGRAMVLAMSGDPMTAEQAFAWGAVNKIVEADSLQSEAQALAVQLANGPTKALGLMKRAFQYGTAVSLESFLNYEADLQEIAGRTSDYQAGVQAFSEKRAPVFSGK
ncbi:MAG: enoyl-CoA hydratase-related protein [Vampirovibrionales bacterium]|nr:enoyl-CoA hydratase-related protein [Vampirovibrionales bacterium]